MEKKPGKITKEKEGFKVVFERVFNHAIEKVWESITDPAQLKFWFTDVEMDFREGGKINIWFRDKDKTLSTGEIVTIKKPFKFVWLWENELAVWELKKLDKNTTQVTFSYSKLPDSYVVSVAAGFHFILDLLEKRLEGSKKLHAFGAIENDPAQYMVQVTYADLIFPEFPEVLKEQPVIIEKTYDAPIDAVWNAITDAALMQEWYFTLDAFKPEKGFKFKFPGQGSKGQAYMHLCEITEITPFKKLQYSWQYEGIPGYSLVTFELSENDKKTHLKLTHHGLGTFPKDNSDFERGSFKGGWTELITKLLNDFLTRNKASYK